MTNYAYMVKTDEKGCYTTVVRNSDGKTKTFFNAGLTDSKRMESFMDSITDTLADSYFPKEKK